MIVVGVLVALGVDQWMTTIDHRRLVNETLYALAAEIAENTVTLDRRIAYHDRILPGLLENLRAAEGGERRSISISGALPEGLGLTPLRSTAWELASVTEAVRHFDLPILSTLSLTYSLSGIAPRVRPDRFRRDHPAAVLRGHGPARPDHLPRRHGKQRSRAGRRAEAILRRDASACASAAGKPRGRMEPSLIPTARHSMWEEIQKYALVYNQRRLRYVEDDDGTETRAPRSPLRGPPHPTPHDRRVRCRAIPTKSCRIPAESRTR